jgi:hypothetical protein
MTSRFETNLLIELAKHTPDSRFCRKCNLLLPLDKFAPNQRRFFCIQHSKRLHTPRKNGTPEKKALETLRSKSRGDKNVFGQPDFKLTNEDIKKILTDEQLKNVPAWCIVPIVPDKPLVANNAIVVAPAHRKHLIASWRENHDTEEYKRILLSE